MEETDSKTKVRFLPDGLVEFEFSVEPPSYHTKMIENFLKMMAKKRKSKEPSEIISGTLDEVREKLRG